MSKNQPFTVIYFIFLLSIINQNAYCQFAYNNVPFKLKDTIDVYHKIIQYNNGEISKIEEYNENGHIIFKYSKSDYPENFNWDKPHYHLYAWEYDSLGRNSKYYAFNSNAGHDIYEYEFNQKKTIKTTFRREFPKKEGIKINSNPYTNISRLQSFKQVQESDEVKEMMSSNREKITVEYLDSFGKSIRIIRPKSFKNDTTYTFIEYDKSNREISRKEHTFLGKYTKEVITSFPNDSSSITQVINYFRGKTFTYQHAQVNQANGNKIQYSVEQGILSVRRYLYHDNYLMSITVYERKFKNTLIVPINKKMKKVAEMKYFYNNLGLLEKEEMYNYETDKKEVREYEYQIIKS